MIPTSGHHQDINEAAGLQDARPRPQLSSRLFCLLPLHKHRSKPSLVSNARLVNRIKSPPVSRSIDSTQDAAELSIDRFIGLIRQPVKLSLQGSLVSIRVPNADGQHVGQHLAIGLNIKANEDLLPLLNL